jgi:uncharacterized protein (DUF983 family)
MNRFTAVIRQRCPVCLEGKVFNALLGTNKQCPVCGLQFERETGYFLNAMFIAYVMGFLILAPLTLLLYLLDVSIPVFSVTIIVMMVICWPLIFRYSRVIWLHVDQVLDPRASPQE